MLESMQDLFSCVDARLIFNIDKQLELMSHYFPDAETCGELDFTGCRWKRYFTVKEKQNALQNTTCHCSYGLKYPDYVVFKNRLVFLEDFRTCSAVKNLYKKIKDK